MLALQVLWVLLRLTAGLCSAGADAIAWTADAGFGDEE